MSKNYYDILGVSRDASQTDIKSAFRRLSKECHPDMLVGKTEELKKAAEARFKEISEAYEILSDDSKRKQYDFNTQRGSQDIDLGSFFRQAGSMFSGFANFGNFGFGSTSVKRPDPNGSEDGRNIKIALDISFKESVLGVKKEFDISIEDVCDACHGTGTADGSKMQYCSHCNGTGYVMQQYGSGCMITMTLVACPTCNGTGYSAHSPCHKCHGKRRYNVKRHMSICIPPGVESGNMLRLQQKGLAGLNGGKAGDMIVVVNVLNSKVFNRIGNNLIAKAYISPTTAILGGEVQVLTPYETLTVKLNTGIWTGQTIMCKGKGIRSGSSVGDLIVDIVVEPLSQLTDELKKLISKLDKTVTAGNLPKSVNYAKEVALEMS